jgi:hypothetical protein
MHLPSVAAIFAIAMVANCQTTTTVTAPAAPVGLDAPYQVRYVANLSEGESYIHMVNTGLNGDSLTGASLGGTTGNICVNLYVIDPNAELIGCCSCLVTPNQTITVGVNQTFPAARNSLSAPEMPLTIKLVGSNANAANCNNSAGQVTASNILSGGVVAFGTTLHVTPVPGVYNETEAPFLPAQVHATGANSELVSLMTRCASILGNSPSFGVCSSCRSDPAAAGGTKHY